MKKPKDPKDIFLFEDDRPDENDEDSALFCNMDEDESREGVFSKIKEKTRPSEKNKENHGFFG